jgi:acyl carrier protein
MIISDDKILELIQNSCLTIDFNKLKPDDSLIKAGFDSMDKASLILEIEEKYNLTIPDVDFDKLDSINSIVIYLKERVV